MERNIIVNGIEVHYKGLFDLDEVLEFVQSFLNNLGYNYHEKRLHEATTSAGKNFFTEIYAVKHFAAYAQLLIKVRFTLAHLKRKKVTTNDQTRVLYEGDITAIIDGWTTTDYEARWTQKPWFYFAKGLISKYIWPIRDEAYIGVIAGESRKFAHELRSFLNLYRFRTKKMKPLDGPAASPP